MSLAPHALRIVLGHARIEAHVGCLARCLATCYLAHSGAKRSWNAFINAHQYAARCVLVRDTVSFAQTSL